MTDNTTDELRKVIREELARERVEADKTPFERICDGHAAEQREREEHDDAA